MSPWLGVSAAMAGATHSYIFEDGRALVSLGYTVSLFAEPLSHDDLAKMECGASSCVCLESFAQRFAQIHLGWVTD